jgi:hypothetical protein
MGRRLFESREPTSSQLIEVGQTAHVCVHADRLWNDSGIDVIWGQTYNFAVPNGEEWITGRRTVCGADGYQSNWIIRPWESLRRVPDANWLQPIGAIGRSVKPPIVIGLGLIGVTPFYPGRRYFFANDLRCMYWNNKGVIALRITRTE